MTSSADDERAEAYRAAVSRLPAGVTVVTVQHGDLDLAMTATAVSSVSLYPPLVLFCVHEDARFRDALDRRDVWAVSVLSDEDAPVADWLAAPGRPAVGQLDRVPHRRGEATGAALLDGAAAWFECRTHAIHRAGDHDVVIGEVLGCGQGDPALGALIHHRGRVRPVR